MREVAGVGGLGIEVLLRGLVDVEAPGGRSDVVVFVLSRHNLQIDRYIDN